MMVVRRILFLFLSFLVIVQAATEEAHDEAQGVGEEEVKEESPLLGTVDYVLISVIAGIGAWYFLFRNSEEKIPDYEIKPMAARQISESTEEKGFIAKMRKTGRRLVVFYGSQTGTAEEFAGRLAKEGARYGLKGVVADPEEEDMDHLTKLQELESELGPCLAVFMLATYGEGDPTDNCMDFHEKLKADDISMTDIRYAVFGLGNRTYEHFNAMASFTDMKLEQMGGERLHPVGMGDDDTNIEEDFITWKEGFWKSVCKEFKIEATLDDFNMRQYSMTVLPDGEYNPERLYTGEIARLRKGDQRPPFDVKNPYYAKVKVNRNLHKETSDRHCMHLEVAIDGFRMRYDAGDHVAVYPTNDQDVVAKLGKLLGVEDMNTVFTMINLDEDAPKKNPFPCPTSFQTALSHYVDIVAIPRTHILKELANYTEDPETKAKLLLMSSGTDEGKALYQKWVVDDCRHLLHILEDLPLCRPPVDLVMEVLPRLQPRFYSISSSGRVFPDTVHITGIVVEYQTPTGRTNKGVCTTWLREKVPREEDGETKYPEIPVFIRRSQFRLPNRPMTPVIMIGPGTGLAPFRGFIQERAMVKDQGKPVGPTVLYFGCRNKSVDYIYEEELEGWKESGVLDLNVAFSRDQAEKRYVTHLLREQGAKIWTLLEDGAHLYVCGDAKMMAKDVRNILVDICLEHGSLSQTAAEAYVKKLETMKRYSADVWS